MTLSLIQERIREARRYRGFSQTELAEKLNLSQAAFARIESGIAPLSIDRAFQILLALSVDFSFLTVDSITIEEADLNSSHMPTRVELINLIDSLSPEGREALLVFSRTLSGHTFSVQRV